MNTDVLKSCPKCNAPIPPEAPQGLCPKCLLSAASIATEVGQSAETSPPPSLETVSAAFPHLEILEFVGQGGMGVVFKARQPKLDRFVALKLLPQKPGADPSFAERFNREARVLARLSHPNIVAVHDFGQAGSFFYLLMEFVDGVNLRQAMRAGRFTPAQALALVPKICDALQYAHEEGILHRDIKPENLLLDTRGRLKIADFGIAKLMGEAKDITLTASGASIGTPHYMAPEQLERPHDVDQRADVYSLGVVFYEMLTGELPIGRFAPPSEKTPMDPRVDQVVLRTLEKERERRFQSAGDVKTQVEQITSNPAVTPLGPSGTVNLSAGGGSAGPPPLSPHPGAAASPTPFRWSVRALIAAALVAVSLVELFIAFVGARHIGPIETVFLLVFIGIPALTGTVLAWHSMRGFQAGSEQRGKRMALLAAVAWPLLLVDLAALVIPLLMLKNLQWHVFHVRSSSLTAAAAFFLTLFILVANGYLLRRIMRRWTSERALPHAEFSAHLRRFSRRTLALSGLALALLLFVLFVNQLRMNNMDQQSQAPAMMDPSAPAGYEVVSGGMPGNDGRVYRSALTIPPGYALTVTVVLCRNQVVLNYGSAGATASLAAPEGAPVQGHLTWRLLGNTTFADGAPIQFSLALEPGAVNASKSFHILPPEPIAVDWVGEPSRIWPPQNGRTKYLLVKGTAATSEADGQPATEWGVGIEVRLDPIPANVLQDLAHPVVSVGTNGLFNVENPMIAAAESTNSTAPPHIITPASAPPEKVAEYLSLCELLEQLGREERELLLRFTPESTIAKGTREQIASNLKLKQKLESDYPSLTSLRASLVPAQAQEKR